MTPSVLTLLRQTDELLKLGYENLAAAQKNIDLLAETFGFRRTEPQAPIPYPDLRDTAVLNDVR